MMSLSDEKQVYIIDAFNTTSKLCYRLKYLKSESVYSNVLQNSDDGFLFTEA